MVKAWWMVVSMSVGGDSAQWESMWPNVNLPKIEARSEVSA